MAKDFSLKFTFSNEYFYNRDKNTRTNNFETRTVSTLKEQIIKNVKTKASKQATQKITEKLVKGALRQKDIKLMTIAIFYQRVIARTPVDEKYRRVLSNDKGLIEKTSIHYPDKDYLIDSWILQIGNYSFPSLLIPDEYRQKVNDKESILYIYNLLKSVFKKNVANTNVNIMNTSKHYQHIEYGRIKQAKSDWKNIYDGYDNKHPHGNIDGYSIQAPVGMYRRTVAELDDIIQEAATYIGKVEDFDSIPILSYIDDIKNNLHITNDEVRSKKYSYPVQTLLKEISKI